MHNLRLASEFRFTLLCLFAIVGTNSRGVGDDSSTSISLEVDRVTALWNGQHAAVRSIHVSGYQFFGSRGGKGTSFSRDVLVDLIDNQIVPLVEQSPDAVTLSQLREITDPILPEKEEDAGPTERDIQNQTGVRGMWRKYEFVMSGSRRVRTLEYGEIVSHLLRDDEGEVTYSSATGAAVRSNPTGLILQDLDDFICRPGVPRRERVAIKPWRPADDAGGPSTMLIAPGVRLEYQSETGFVYDYYLHVPHLQTYKERLQRLPHLSPQQVGIPRVSAQLEFHRLPGDPPPLSAWYVFVLNSIRINEPVPDTRFQIAVPAGARVAKHIPRRDRPVIVRAPADVTDVRAFVASSAFAEAID